MKFLWRRRLFITLTLIFVVFGANVCLSNAEIPYYQKYQSGEIGNGIFWEYIDESSCSLSIINRTGEPVYMPDWETADDVPWSKSGIHYAELINIGEGILNIGAHSFENIVSLETGAGCGISWPKHLKTIGDYAFANSTIGTSLKIPDTVETIGNYAFAGCYAYPIIIPASVREIGDYAFEGIGRRELDSLVRGDKICRIVFKGDAPKAGIKPFDKATSDTEIYIPHGNKTWTDKVKKSFGGSAKWYEYGGQTITVSASLKRSLIVGKSFSLGAKTTGKSKLTFKSSNKDVASIDNNGRVTLKGAGKTVITITAPKGGEWYAKNDAAIKKVTLNVYLAGTSLSSVKKISGRRLAIRWKKQKNATGYIIQYSTSKSFKKNVKSIKVKNKNTLTKATGKLKKNKTYYVRIRTYRNVQKIKDDIVYTKTYYSGYSKARAIRVK